MITKKIISKFNFHIAREAAHYYIKAGFWRGHRIHSPFVYHIIRHIITTRHRTDYVAAQRGLLYRSALLHSNQILSITDLGTGATKAPKQRSVKSIARNAAITEKYGLMLYRLVEELKPHRILELGTSLGISTQYMAQALTPDAHLSTIEGSSESALIASEQLQKFGYAVDLRIGNFDDLLPQILAEKELPNFFFIDGNHTCEATLRYFNQIAEKTAHLPDITTIVFDDIHWSAGMTEAWQTIVADPRVSTSIDLFRVGIVFFRKGCQKEFYRVRW